MEGQLKITQGLATSNNDRFVRFWWEIAMSLTEKNKSEESKWYTYAKGGNFKKWSGNLWTVVNWSENGFEIKNFVDEKGKQRSRPNNENYYFKEGVTYTFSGVKASFRLLPKNSIFDVSGSSAFSGKYSNINYSLAFLNSKIVNYILSCFNPTASTQVGDIKRLPFVTPQKADEQFIELFAKININISNNLLSFSLVERSFLASPITKIENKLDTIVKKYLNYENILNCQVLVNEAIINDKIFEVYDLTPSDRAMVLAKEGESIGGLPILATAKKAYLENEIVEFPLDNIRDYIKNLPEKDFKASEREAIEDEFPALYQSNNDLEEFCIRHQVNPINVWYWFKESNVIPKQRMNTVAMEFLADMIREILMEDEDGIIPLVPNAGEKVLLDRIEEKFIEKGFSMAQYSSFDGVLGKNIKEYINGNFFKALSDHLNLFMYLPKTPFIWHITSGPEQGFDCYIIIYKWNRDKLLRIRSVYIENRERALSNRQSDLRAKETLSAADQNEADKIYKQLQEIESFKTKIDALLEEGYNPILDDGVGKNIAPLQKKGMLAYEVLNAGQLKKYLNANW